MVLKCLSLILLRVANLGEVLGPLRIVRSTHPHDSLAAHGDDIDSDEHRLAHLRERVDSVEVSSTLRLDLPQNIGRDTELLLVHNRVHFLEGQDLAGNSRELNCLLGTRILVRVADQHDHELEVREGLHFLEALSIIFLVRNTYPMRLVWEGDGEAFARLLEDLPEAISDAEMSMVRVLADKRDL